MALPGVTTENWLLAIAAYDEVSMSCGIRAEPMRRPILAARSRSVAVAHLASPPSAARALAALAALDEVVASALVPPVRNAAAPAALLQEHYGVFSISPASCLDRFKVNRPEYG
jgi:hypothetical protein